MNYFYLMYNDETGVSNPIVPTIIKIKGLSEYGFELEQGNKFAWNKTNELLFENDGVAEDYMANTIPAPLVSGGIKYILENKLHVDGVEFYPIKIKHTKSNKVLDNYFIMNVLNVVDALDLSKSLKGPELGGKINIIKYVLKKEKIKNIDIFRIENYKFDVFVSEKVKEAFEKTGITGLSYGSVKLV